jgi:hypothetical protein
LKLRALLSVAAVVAVGAVGVVSSAGAASAPTQYFTAAQTNVAGKTTVVAAGPISANGTDVESTRHLGTFTFPRGSLTVKHETTSRKDSFDSRTCVFTSLENGTYVIIRGTGAYRVAVTPNRRSRSLWSSRRTVH